MWARMNTNTCYLAEPYLGDGGRVGEEVGSYEREREREEERQRKRIRQ